MTTASAIVVLLKEEKSLDLYVEVLHEKLLQALESKKDDVKVWEYYVNQEAQESFMLMHKLLGKEHAFVKVIPQHISDYYAVEEEKILNHGKENYILYQNHMEQVEGDVNHAHAYTSEPYSIYIDDKLVHQGLTNKYGCMRYKYYGAKSSDIIEFRTYVGIRGKQAVGWIEELSSWNSRKGLFERMASLGFIYYENESVEGYIWRFQRRYELELTKEYNEETAKKADELLKMFMDEKWCNKS
jgi:hypothetical protein